MNINSRVIYINHFVHKLINKIQNLLIFNFKRDINIDYTAQLFGMKYVDIGKNFHAGKFLRLEAVYKYGKEAYTPAIIIKDNVIINDFVHIGATNYIEIGNNVLIASKVYISDHNHGYYSGDNQSSPLIPPSKRIVSNDKKVIIGDNVWIGESVSILPGVTIGKGSIIGANSVVTKDIPDYSIAIGIPARIIKKYDFSIKKWMFY